MSPHARLDALQKEIILIKQDNKLSRRPVKLLGVSKTQSPEAIEPFIRAGLTDFGENRVQEAEAKWPALKARYPDVQLHLIGPLQANKVKQALALFDVIQTLDRPKLVEEITKQWHETSRCRSFYVQVNVGEEPQKAGVAPSRLADFLALCKKKQLPVIGLMCIPPADKPAAPYFALLRKLAAAHGFQELSMGMSGDYQTAIRMGATLVRVGTKLFGERS